MEERRTVRRIKERGVLPGDAEPNGEHREDVEDEDAEERRADRTRDGLVRGRALARRERDELDAAVRVERVHERLCERTKAAHESLSVVEVRETLQRL